MESAERLLSQLRCGNIVEEYSFSMAILDCPPLTIQWSISNNDAIKYIESRDAAIRKECADSMIAELESWEGRDWSDLSKEEAADLIKRRLRSAIEGKEVPERVSWGT